MDSIIQALSKKMRQWNEDLYIAGNLMRQKLTNL